MSKFKNKIVEDDYRIFDETNELKKAEIDEYKREIKAILLPWAISLREAFDIEDFNSKGWINMEQFKSVLRQLEINLKKVHVEYLIYEMYKYSKNSQKLNYSTIFDVIGLPKEDEFSSNKQIRENIDEIYDEFNSEDHEVKRQNTKSKKTTFEVEESKDSDQDILRFVFFFL